MIGIMRRSLATATACVAALSAASCGPAAPHNTGVYLLLDTSGTYREELDKAKQIINFTLARLDGLDTFAVARIDTGSFSEQDIMAKVTLDDRPSAANAQKREFAQQINKFLDETPSSPYTDITGGLLQAVEGGGGVKRRAEHEQVGGHHPGRRPLQSGRHHAGTRLQVRQHVVQRCRLAHHVVREVEQRRVRMALQRRLRGAGLQQGDVAPAVVRDAVARQCQHVRRGVDADNAPGRADAFQQRCEAEARAAADVQHGGAGGRRELRDRPGAQRLERRQFQVVVGRAPPVGAARTGSIGPPARAGAHGHGPRGRHASV